MPTYQPNITMGFIYTNFLNIMRSVAFQTLNVYVNSVTGQDAGPGRGSSPTSAYKTLKAALTNAFVLSNEAQVVLHLAGADPFSVPDGMTFPQLSSPDQITLNPTPTFGFNKRAPLVIRATPTLFTTIAALNVVSQANNAFSGMKEITTTGGLVVNALQGKWLQDANGVLARVSSNAAAVINIDYSGVDLTAPFLIYDEGATITPADPLSGNPTVNLRGGTTPIVFFGVAIVASAGGAVQVGPGQQAAFIACDIPSLSAGSSNNSNLSLPAAVECVACNMASLSLPAANLYLENCRFSAGTFTNVSKESKVEASSCSFSGMASALFSDGTNSPKSVSLSGCSVNGSTTHGILMLGGELLTSAVDVADNADSGIVLESGAFANLKFVKSSVANTDFGLLVKNGSVVVDGDTDVAGLLQDIKIGNLTINNWAANFRTGEKPYGVNDPQSQSLVIEDANNATAAQNAVTVVSTTPYLVTKSDQNIMVDATAAPVSVTLPPIASCFGLELTIKKTDVSANAVTVDGGASNIDGALTFPLAAQFNSVTIVAGATAWHIKASF